MTIIKYNNRLGFEIHDKDIDKYFKFYDTIPVFINITPYLCTDMVTLDVHFFPVLT